MQTLYKVFFFLEGRKMFLGSIGLLILTYLLGRHLVASDTAALVSGIMAVLGFTAAGVTSTNKYQTALGAAIKNQGVSK